MSLTAGAKLGPYEIVGALGAGGMGEGYRARDRRLGRTIAIKVLPESFARDGDRLQRFEREARVLSTRPDECSRLRWAAITWSNGRNGTFLVTHGKTAAARRVLPMTPRVRALLEERWGMAGRPC
jgi:integrase